MNIAILQGPDMRFYGTSSYTDEVVCERTSVMCLAKLCWTEENAPGSACVRMFCWAYREAAEDLFPADLYSRIMRTIERSL